VTLGLRFPLGSSDKHRAAIASAGAEQTEAEVAVRARAGKRQVAMVRSARAALGAARTVLATCHRARPPCVRRRRSFFDKSFRLGETDLPTRLRVELEAATAQREQARARIEVHHAIATLRQAMGLLPRSALSATHSCS
jgi:cobalt-zinc-cadmium efflux system outer membrane protein